MKPKIISLPGLLFLFSIMAVWWITAFKIEPFLHYHYQQIGFCTTFDFLEKHLVHPGGVAGYIAEFISQFFSFKLAGSFIIVLVVALQGFIVIQLLKRFTPYSNLHFLFFGLVLLLGVMVLTDYRYPYYASIRLLFAFLFVFIFNVTDIKFPKYSIYAWPFFATLLFYLASGSALIVFAVSTGFILIHTRQVKYWLLIIPLFWLFAVALPLVVYKFISPSDLMNLYRITEVKPPQMLAYTVSYPLIAYYVILPAILLIMILVKRVVTKPAEPKMVKGKVRDGKVVFYKKELFFNTMQVALLIAIGWILFVNSYDSFRKKLIYIEYYAENEQWEDVIKVAEKINVYDFRINYQMNRAYYHLGMLPDKLFTYPQLLGSSGLFFDTSSMNGSFTMPISDLYFDLSFMSESLHWAFEAQTLLPNSPRVLKRLIMINLVNRNYDVAGKFLQVLEQNMLCNDWVEKYSKYITDTTLAANDKIIAEKRRFNPVKNTINRNPLENLKLLLETNKDNNMAYEYLLALCILDSNLPDFIAYLPDYRYYKITTLPDSWAEALAVYILKIKSMPSFVDAKTISKECLQRFSTFNSTIKQFNNDKNTAQSNLKRNFENTYWYYLLYLSPNVTHVLNNKTLIE